MQNSCCAVILAAGDGKKMNASLPSAMAEVLFQPMIDWALHAVQRAGIESVCTVAARCEALVSRLEGRGETALLEPSGTGSVILQARAFLERFRGGDVFLLHANTPLMDADTIHAALAAHQQAGNAATILSAQLENPSGYHRILRGADGAFAGLAAQQDAGETALQIREVSSGAGWFQCDQLLWAMDQIAMEGADWADMVQCLLAGGRRVDVFTAADPDSLRKADDRVQLLHLNGCARQRMLKHWLWEGVDIPCADGVIIGPGVTIGADTRILPGAILRGKTVIGKSCVIGPNTQLIDTLVGDDVKLDNVLSEQAEIQDGADIGPFVHLRPHAKIGPHTHLGNFVEVKNAQIGEGTKVSHLTYVGDADVGKSVNFGCGCVTVNYTGKEKHRTVIGDHAFIGCNSNLVAPVKVGDYGYTAAGSTITDDVPANALAIARARQVNKEGWVLRKKPYKGMK